MTREQIRRGRSLEPNAFSRTTVSGLAGVARDLERFCAHGGELKCDTNSIDGGPMSVIDGTVDRPVIAH